MPEDLYYYPSVIAHDSDTTCSIIWLTILKVGYYRDSQL